MGMQRNKTRRMKAKTEQCRRHRHGGISKGPYQAIKILSTGNFQSAQFFGAEMKKINIYNFPKQAKISKIAQIYLKHLRKKNPHEYFQA